jgi:hypothetical protein
MSDAAFTLKVDIPGMAKGDKVGIPGLGEFENGSSTDISAEQAEMYSLLNATQEMVYDEETNEVLGAKSVPGPALDKVDMYGVTVEKSGSKSKKSGGDN